MELIAICFWVIAFLFGVIMGSFLNVVIYRLGSGVGFGGRSKCLSCGKTLRPMMLIPVLSYVLQRGRCAFCKARISCQYPIVELLSGGAAVLALWVNHVSLLTFAPLPLSLAFIDAVIWMTLLLIMVYDLKHQIIPDRLSLLFALLAGLSLAIKYTYGLVALPYIPIFDSVPKWIDIAAGPLLFLPFATLWYLSAGRAMGLGDAKLSWGIGWFLGISGGITALVFAFWIAFFPSLFLLFVRGKHFTMKSEIPFAPFLILGTLVVYAFHFDLLQWTF